MHARRSACLMGALAVLVTSAAQAQPLYRIVGPDGRVTYTDRPPAGTPAAPAGASAGPAGDAMANWPAPLRTAATRFPVTLYAADGCPPCDDARQMLLRRGVPYAEKRVRSEEDARRLEQLTGGRLVPAATIGRQALSGFQEQDWQGWLDSAGYPRNRMLPPNWQPPPATALVPRPAAAVAAPAASEPTPRPAPLPAPAPGPGPGGIRF
jgi:glutaredoxin